MRIKIHQIKDFRSGVPHIRTVSPAIKQKILAEIKKTNALIPKFGDALKSTGASIMYDPDGIVHQKTGNPETYTKSMYMTNWNIIVLDDPGIDVSLVHEATHALDVSFGKRYGILFSSLIYNKKIPTTSKKKTMDAAEAFATATHYWVGYALQQANKLNLPQAKLFDLQKEKLIKEKLPEAALELFHAHILALVFFSVKPPPDLGSVIKILDETKLI